MKIINTLKRSDNFLINSSNINNIIEKFNLFHLIKYNVIEISKYNFTQSDSNKNTEKISKEQTNKIKHENVSNKIKVNFDDIKHSNDINNDLLYSQKKIESLEKNRQLSEKKNLQKNFKIDMNFDKSNTNQSNSTLENSDLILIYSQQTGMKYYIYNSIFLSGYVVYFWLNVFKDIPEPLYSTIIIFGTISHILLIGLLMLSNRQIRNLYLKRNSKFLIVETFSLLRFKKKVYLLESDKIKEVRTNPLMRKMNLFYFTYKDKFGFFKILDYFIFRPTSNTSQIFDSIFKTKLKR